MSISTQIEYAALDELYLDPKNPRLGRHNVVNGLSQQQILDIMATWTLEELALSYLENGGFWTHEALLVVKEELEGEPGLVVVEGNRRLAALRLLRDAYEGKAESRKWDQISKTSSCPPELFSKIPYLLADSRADVQSFLGFRHVTGIKQWDADEKAGFIARLIDEGGLSYEQVMRKIGSKTPTVRKHYIGYCLLLQIEKTVEDFEPEQAEGRFAILYMAIDTEGVRQYLGIEIDADPDLARTPVPKEHLKNLESFARWLFGNKDTPPLVTDTRQVVDFGRILESGDAVEYLERTPRPNFDVAFRIAGGDEPAIIRYVESAADSVELALTRAHQYKNSTDLMKAVRRLGTDARQLLSIFPEIFREIFMAEQETR